LAAKVEAPITHKTREFASCSGGVIVANYISCKEKQTLRRMHFFFLKKNTNIKFVTNFEVEKLIGTHSQSVG
jgi:hypothetical protein